MQAPHNTAKDFYFLPSNELSISDLSHNDQDSLQASATFRNKAKPGWLTSQYENCQPSQAEQRRNDSFSSSHPRISATLST